MDISSPNLLNFDPAVRRCAATCISPSLMHLFYFISARCNICISRLYYDFSVHLSVTEVHLRIISNLGFNSDPSLQRIAVAVHAGAREGIIAGKSEGIFSRYASHC